MGDKLGKTLREIVDRELNYTEDQILELEKNIHQVRSELGKLEHKRKILQEKQSDLLQTLNN